MRTLQFPSVVQSQALLLTLIGLLPKPHDSHLGYEPGPIIAVGSADTWRGRWDTPLASLRLLLNVLQNTQENLMHDRVGPYAPINLRPEIVLIPGRPF